MTLVMTNFQNNKNFALL